MSKKVLNYILILAVIPLLIILGVAAFGDRKYMIISMAIAIVALIPFLMKFEKKKTSTKEIVIIAVMTAISVAGRCLFAVIPGFKPITAIVLITAIYFGSEAGFVVGAFSALISNIFYGQGPWTPFQMFVWGILGFIGGIVAKKGWLDNRIGLILYSILGGVLYSMLMDIWTVLAMDGTFSITRYIAAVGTSLPFMTIYAVSNVVFILPIKKLFGPRLERIKRKYQI